MSEDAASELLALQLELEGVNGRITKQTREETREEDQKPRTAWFRE